MDEKLWILDEATSLTIWRHFPRDLWPVWCLCTPCISLFEWYVFGVTCLGGGKSACSHQLHSLRGFKVHCPRSFSSIDKKVSVVLTVCTCFWKKDVMTTRLRSTIFRIMRQHDKFKEEIQRIQSSKPTNRPSNGQQEGKFTKDFKNFFSKDKTAAAALNSLNGTGPGVLFWPSHSQEAR